MKDNFLSLLSPSVMKDKSVMEARGGDGKLTMATAKDNISKG